MPTPCSSYSSLANEYSPVDLEDFQHTNDDNDNEYSDGGDDDIKRAADNTDIIGTLIGKIGKWQWKWVLIISMFQLISTLNIVCFQFQVSVLFVYLNYRFTYIPTELININNKTRDFVVCQIFCLWSQNCSLSINHNVVINIMICFCR